MMLRHFLRYPGVFKKRVRGQQLDLIRSNFPKKNSKIFKLIFHLQFSVIVEYILQLAAPTRKLNLNDL